MKKNLSLLILVYSSTILLNIYSSNYIQPFLADPLYKYWQLDAVIVDGAETEPGATMADDILYINEDLTIQTVLAGVILNGTWMIDQSNSWLTITSTDLSSVMRLKILLITDTELKIERVNGEGVKTILLFEPE